MQPLLFIFTLALVLGNSHAAETNRSATKPVNLLFIMTDQLFGFPSIPGFPETMVLN